MLEILRNNPLSFIRSRVKSFLNSATKNSIRSGLLLVICSTNGGASTVQTKSQHGQPYHVDINQVIDSFKIKDQHIAHALHLLGLNDVAVGAEILDINSSKISVELRNATVKQILDNIVSQLPGYRWEKTDKVIHIFPSEVARTKSVLRFLDEKMSVFHSSGLNVTETISYLNQQAHDQGIPIALDFHRSSSSWEDSADRTPLDEKITINVSTPTRLRDLLDIIVGIDPPAIWHALPMPGNGQLGFAGGTFHAHKEESPHNMRSLKGCDKHGRRIKIIHDGKQWKEVPGEPDEECTKL